LENLSNNPTLTVDLQGPPSLSFEPFLPIAVLLVLAGLAVFLSLRSYARTSRPLAPRRKLVLAVLRSAAAFTVLVCLARPVWVQALSLREKGLCFLALDTSASMNLRDAPEHRTRWEFSGSLFAQHQDDLAELGRNFEVRRLIFDAVTRETQRLPGEDSGPQAVRADGRSTNLLELLDRLSTDAGGSSCVGALVISDGRHNAPGDPALAARKLKALGVPLFVVGVGQEATPDDYQEVQIKLLDVPERSFVGGKVVMRVEIESNLPGDTATPFQITVNGAVVLEESLSLSKGQNLIRREVTFTPRELGMHRVSATVTPLPEEANPNNNQRTAYFRVHRSKLGIWYAEGAIRKEFGAIRSALQSAPNVDLRAFNSFGPRGGNEDNLLPDSEQLWSEQRLVILGDLPARRFSFRELERLEKFVADGGAVLLIGGLENFGPGGWGMTPIAKALPVELGRADGEQAGPLPLIVAPEGLSHPALRITPVLNELAERFAKLPPVPGVNGVGAPKPAAKVLMSAGRFPLLAVQDYGKGRSAVFTMDMTWQWVLKAGQEETHKAFWRTLATWLTRSEYRDTGKAIFVETDRLQYLLGEEAQLRAHVQETDTLGKKIEDARIAATLTLEGGAEKKWDLGHGKGEFLTRRAPQLPGNYTYKVEALGPNNQVYDQDVTSFRVEVPDVENDNPKANLQLLRHLAQLSNGTYYDAEQAGEAFKKLLARTLGYAKTVKQPTELWNHWTLFMLFVALLSAEWALRKRWNLA